MLSALCRYHWLNCRTNFEFWEKLCRSLNGSPRPVPAPKTIQTGSLLRGSGSDPRSEKYFSVSCTIQTCALLCDSGSDPRCQRSTFSYYAQFGRARCFAIQGAIPDARRILSPIISNPNVCAASRYVFTHTAFARGAKKKIYIYIIFPLPNPHISFHIPLHILPPSRSFVRVRALEMYITFLSNFWADMHIESECDGVHHASKSLPGGSLVRWASQGFGPFFARPSPRLQSVAFV